jgi:antitoxin YefM
MPSLKPSQDIQPLSAFRANAAAFLKSVRESQRPLVLTQHGKSAAVVLDVEQYENLLEELEVIRDIREARAELERGEGIPHPDVIAQLKARVSP